MFRASGSSARLRELALVSHGGGVPWRNCGCRLARSGDGRVKPRAQSSLGVSADGENRLLPNAFILNAQ